MGRIGDTGPYSPENTKCITNSENGYDRRINGVAARGEQKSNLTEKQVREIYFSTDSLKVLSQRYPVGMGGIAITLISVSLAHRVRRRNSGISSGSPAKGSGGAIGGEST